MKVGARKLKQVISTGAERSKGRQEQMPMLQVPNWVKRYYPQAPSEAVYSNT